MENMRLILWTVVAAAAIWFITMTVNRNIFNHSNVERSLTGTIPMSRTDIGDKCGAQYVNANEFVQYKVTPTGQLVYLCPQGLWPIQTTVNAVTLTPDFRNTVSPTFRAKLDLYYPPAGATQTNNNPFNTTPPATSTQGVPTAPVFAAPPAAAPAPTQSPGFQGTQQQRGTKNAAPAAPAQNVNPFIGAPATH
jgi:hypothetical protein